MWRGGVRAPTAHKESRWTWRFFCNLPLLTDALRELVSDLKNHLVSLPLKQSVKCIYPRYTLTGTRNLRGVNCGRLAIYQPGKSLRTNKHLNRALLGVAIALSRFRRRGTVETNRPRGKVFWVPPPTIYQSVVCFALLRNETLSSVLTHTIRQTGFWIKQPSEKRELPLRMAIWRSSCWLERFVSAEAPDLGASNMTGCCCDDGGRRGGFRGERGGAGPGGNG